MHWTAIDEEILDERPVGEPRTLRFLRQVAYVAIGRWLISGLDLPDSDATDGISETEESLEWES